MPAVQFMTPAPDYNYSLVLIWQICLNTNGYSHTACLQPNLQCFKSHKHSEFQIVASTKHALGTRMNRLRYQIRKKEQNLTKIILNHTVKKNQMTIWIYLDCTGPSAYKRISIQRIAIPIYTEISPYIYVWSRNWITIR